VNGRSVTQVEKRLIPVLLFMDGKVMKTTKFKSARYVGDLVNTALMFNEFEVDELFLFDIGASKRGIGPDLKVLSRVVKQCFMPLTYGGGLVSVTDASRVLELGIEKICLNSVLLSTPTIATALSKEFGSQAVVGSIDVKRDKRGIARVWSHATNEFFKTPLKNFVEDLQDNGVGEFVFTSVDREGTWTGPDVEGLRELDSILRVPWIIHGGVASASQLKSLLTDSSCSGVGVGSLFVYQKRDRGVLVGIPDEIAETMRDFC
jgi:cyclase